ncbi:hypothetical protein [Collinsella tanakaei]|uniref:Uncharacterized protein n=1 Tax=Collinsella tanakaei YIT 12063 TaxID=742742 RepID=G1WIZ2_9ACTN|nr:hypothetical protein [Collinsella tanakaei]EGX70619.1 hypothetical protein HMPREF9452_01305 [Collinsella tanakaei YIT 12063]
MGLETKKILVCDRCGESVEVDGDAAEFELARSLPDWIRLEGGRALCPRCRERYELILARHRVEIDDYLNGRL